MTTKKILAQAFEDLKHIGINFDALSSEELDEKLATLGANIDLARTQIRHGGHKPVYAIGIEHQPGVFGMTNGPVPDVMQMLSCCGQENSCIIRFQPGPDGEQIETITHRWKDDDWVVQE